MNSAAPCDLFASENLAIALSYFSVGVAMSFISTPLNVYMVNILNAEPPMQSTISILQTLPWSLKLIFGFLSDVCPIYGAHRKPYLTFGALLYSFAFITYALSERHDIVFLALCIFCGTMGLICMDVMADTMIVERSKFEPPDIQGQMQATCYSIRFGGGLIGAVGGTILSNSGTQWAEGGWGLSFSTISLINGLIPFMLVIPWVYSLKEKYVLEDAHGHGTVNIDECMDFEEIEMTAVDTTSTSNEESSLLPKRSEPITYSSFSTLTTLSISKSRSGTMTELPIDVPDVEDNNDCQITGFSTIDAQLTEIWRTVQLKAVWKPMAFIYIFNMLQVPNVAWQSYLQLSLHFPPWILGLNVTVGSFMTFAGVLAFKYFFFKAAWRSIYLYSTCLTTMFSLLQLVLIFQINKTYLHMNNYLFSLGDDVVQAYISGIQFLPVCIMYMKLCPDGAEGSSYAMLTTFGNIALVCGSNIGNALAGIWDVSNNAMRANDIDGLWRLSLFTSLISVLPLGLLFLLPQNQEEQERLGKSSERSKTGGMVFLVVLFGSILWTVCTAVVRLVEAWA